MLVLKPLSNDIGKCIFQKWIKPLNMGAKSPPVYIVTCSKIPFLRQGGLKGLMPRYWHRFPLGVSFL